MRESHRWATLWPAAIFLNAANSASNFSLPTCSQPASLPEARPRWCSPPCRMDDQDMLLFFGQLKLDAIELITINLS